MRRQQQQGLVLIPGLRDSMALLCLARLPRESYPSLKRVSKLWRSALVSKHLYKLRKAMGLEEPWIYVPFFCPNSQSLPRGPSNWIEAYDPRSNAWHYIGAIPGMEDGQLLKGFATAVIGHRLLVIGGKIIGGDEELRISREVHALNCITGKWSQCASMAQARADFACTVTAGLVYVAGGRTDTWQARGIPAAEVYNPDTNTWTPLPRMTIGRYRCVGVPMRGRVFVVGGFASTEGPLYGSGGNSSPVYGVERSSVDVYDPKAGTWTLVKGMWQLDVPPNQIVAMLDGRLYSSGDVLNIWKGRVEVYDEGLNIWKIVEGSQRLRNLELVNSEQRYLTMAPIGQSLVFIGGYRTRWRCGSGAAAAEVDQDGGLVFEVDDQKQVEEGNEQCKDEEEEECDEVDHKTVQAASVFDTLNGTWSNMEPLVADRCKDLCSHCLKRSKGGRGFRERRRTKRPATTTNEFSERRISPPPAAASAASAASASPPAAAAAAAPAAPAAAAPAPASDFVQEFVRFPASHDR